MDASAGMVGDAGTTSSTASLPTTRGQEAAFDGEKSSGAERSPRPQDKQNTNPLGSDQNRPSEASDAGEPSRLQKLEQTVAEIQLELRLVSEEVGKSNERLRGGNTTAKDASSITTDEGAADGVETMFQQSDHIQPDSWIPSQLSTKVQRALWNPSDELGKQAMPQFSQSVLAAFYGTTTGGTGGKDPAIKPQADDVSETRKTFTDLKMIQINSPTLLRTLVDIMNKAFPIPTVVFAPWKLFICFEPEISEYLDHKKVTLDTECGASGPFDNAKAPTEDDQEASDDAEPRPELLSETPEAPTKDTDITVRQNMEEEISHLQCLLDFIHTDLGHLLELRSQVRNGTLESVAFEYVRHVFDLGDVVLASSDSGNQAYRVNFISGGREKFKGEKDQDSRVILDCFCLCFDGSKIGPRNARFVIKKYHGERRITELGVYPAQFHESSEIHMSMLTQRGARFREICFGDRKGHKTYDGVTVGRDPEMICGEVYIDFDTGLIDQPKEEFGKVEPFEDDNTDSPEISGLFPDYLVEFVLFERFEPQIRSICRVMEPEDDIMNESRLQLLPQGVLGYVFRSRAWRQLDVNIIKDIDYSEDARDKGFEQLVIPDSHRNLLLALVNSHPSGPKSDGGASNKARLQMDLVKGKGTGLIFLLHGPPGVGKTSTAETIASYTCRPLYPITCGDLGATPKEVEESLAHHFSLAHRWGCVLLLDEADVFLAKRDRDDVVRNGLVSVFLRTLEYYSGILFLTTNRVGVIDEAFKSRIHVSLRYPSLRSSSTRQIWEKTLDRIKDENKSSPVKVEFEKNDLLEWATNHYREHKKTKTTWNGRQIRNAFQTSMALAQYDRAKLLKKKKMTDDDAIKKGKPKYLTAELNSHHFDLVAATAKDFEKYMVAVRQDDAEVAKQEQLRNDEYDPAVSQPARKNYGASRKMSAKGKTETQKQEATDGPSSSEGEGFPSTSGRQKELDTSSDEE